MPTHEDYNQFSDFIKQMADRALLGKDQLTVRPGNRQETVLFSRAERKI